MRNLQELHDIQASFATFIFRDIRLRTREFCCEFCLGESCFSTSVYQEESELFVLLRKYRLRHRFTPPLISDGCKPKTCFWLSPKRVLKIRQTFKEGTISLFFVCRLWRFTRSQECCSEFVMSREAYAVRDPADSTVGYGRAGLRHSAAFAADGANGFILIGGGLGAACMIEAV